MTLADLCQRIARLKDGASKPPASDSELLDALVPIVRAPGSSLSDDLVRSIYGLATDARPALRDVGQRLLFSGIAETLGDTFSGAAVHLHDAIFAQVIDSSRTHPAGAAIDAQLEQFGIRSRDDLLRRKASIAGHSAFPAAARAAIEQVFVLPRVTLGADVAVTSVVLQKIERIFPQASCTVIGPIGADLFGAGGTVRVVRQAYDKRGDLLQRLGAWVDVVRIVEREMSPKAIGRTLIIDPDSRLTQLGLLPLAGEDVPYCFFESRSYQKPGVDTLSELTAAWLDETFGSDDAEPLFPRVSLMATDLARGSFVLQRLRENGAPRIIAINLGVGGNSSKRLTGSFEVDLIRGLLADGNAVIVDYGVGEELQRIDDIVSTLRGDGRTIGDLDGRALEHAAIPSEATVLTYRGGVGPFAGLVAASDLYVGYDSGFQHIAAALCVPVIDIFVNPPTPLFARRWRPHSRTDVTAIRTSGAAGPDVLADVLRACRSGRLSGDSSLRQV